MSLLSIVIPRIGNREHFESTLASVLRYRMPHHQVIVVQSDLQADTYGLEEEEVRFVEVSGRPGLARYINQALEWLEGRVINLILPGVEVTHHWFAEGIRKLQDDKVGSVACTLVTAQHRDEIVSRGLISNRRMLPVHSVEYRQKPMGPCKWAAFYRSDVLRAIGNLDESISDDFVAIDLALAIQKLNLICQLADDRALTIANSNLLIVSNRPKTGRDAQRMFQRHLAAERQGVSGCVAIATDILANFLRPSRWGQVAGRFSARSLRATDRAFGRRVDLARHELNSTNDLSKRHAA